MASTPIPRSYSKIIGELVGTVISKTGISRLKIGNPLLSTLESVAQSQLRSSGDIFQLLAAQSLDNATGAALQNIGNSENVPILGARASGGFVTISDTSFTKKASQVYQGTAAPVVGTVSLNIIDASTFPSSGSVYIGRGTTNFEGPLAYSAKVNNTSYWTLTLSSGTTRFHNLNESVVLAQGGDRTVTAGSIVQTPQANSVQSVQFRTLNSVVIPDGETSLSNVSVVSQRVGTAGNVGAGDIQQFATPPFNGATATNPTSFTNGRETENDDDYRNRIRVARQTRALGTKLTLTNAVLGLFDQTENKSVVSSSYVVRIGSPDTLYIDDGSGYEEVTEGVPQDVILAVATGGEQYFQVDSALPITKAFLETTVSAPFALKDGSSLMLLVGDTASEHSFATGDFRDIGAATAFEVVASINGNGNLLFSARPSENGTKVSIFAKSSTFEYMQIQSIDNNANDALGFPLIKAETIRLFKNDQLLVKDGAPAIAYSLSFGQWGALIGSQTLEIAIDGTPVSTFTFVDNDFVSNNTGYLTVGNNSLDAWIIVLNAKVPGVTFTKSFSTIQVVSNKGNSASAIVDIQGGTLVSNGVFNAALTAGHNNDYIFDRNIGQIKLTIPLVSGDTLIAGSSATRAFVQGPALSPSTLATDGKIWFGIDANDYKLIPTGITTTTALDVTLSTDKVYWGYPTRFTNISPIFSAVTAGDLAIISDPGLPAGLIGAWRVLAASTNWFEIGRANTASKRRQAASCVLADGRVFVCGGFADEMVPNPLSGPPSSVTLSSAEIYDPATNIWTPINPMTFHRGDHQATLLANGKVLVTGGFSDSNNTTVKTDEIYDPGTGLWASITSLSSTECRAGHTATLLTAGPNINKVLVAGGFTSALGFSNVTCWIYDPSIDTWAATGSTSIGHSYMGACTVPGGDYLIVGGFSAGAAPTAIAERYSNAAGTWSAANSASVARGGGAMVYSVTSGRAEYYGGSTMQGSGAANDQLVLDRYNDIANTWSVGASATGKRAYSPWVLAAAGKIVAYGGGTVTSATTRAEVYNSGANTWSLAAVGLYDGLNYRYALGSLIAGNKVLISHGAHPNDPGSLKIKTDYAISSIYDVTGDTWLKSDPIIDTTVTLSEGGIKFISSNELPQTITVPAAANYTATSFAATINSLLKGAFASTFKTNQLRVTTNTFDSTVGGIGIMAENSSALALGLLPSNPIISLVGSNGSSESATSEIDFAYKIAMLIPGRNATSLNIFNGDLLTDSSYNMLFNKHQTTFGGVTGDTGATNFLKSFNYGSSWGFYDQIKTQTVDRNVTMRSYPDSAIISDEWISAMLPYRFTWQDTLNVLVDQDTASKNYQAPMARKLLTQGTTYATTNTFKDASNGNASLAVAFGFGANGFDFNDFAIAMPSRTLVDSSDATRRLLWRWSRIGADGDGLLLEYILASSANATASVAVNSDTVSGITKPVIQVRLSSGAPITISNINASTGLGVGVVSVTNSLANVIVVANLVANTGQVAANVATLTLTLPPGVTDHGLLIGTGFTYSGDAGTLIAAGNYQISGVTATTISFALATVNFGPSPLVSARVSMGAAGFGAVSDFTGLAVNNLFRIQGNSVTNIPSPFSGTTYRIKTISGSFDYFNAVQRTNAGFLTNTVLTWGSINSIQNAIAFQNTTETATALATHFTTGIIVAKVTGGGAGVISQSTAEFLNDGTFYYTLTDGYQNVNTTTIPGSIIGNYSFAFKNSIAASLATNSDWANETVYAIPVTTKNCVNWLSSESVSGIGNSCTVARSTRGTKVQITTNTPGSSGSVQVKGGTGNQSSVSAVGEPTVNTDNDYLLVSTSISDLAGFTGQSEAIVQNSNVLSRNNPLGSPSVVSSVSVGGQFHLSTGALGIFNTTGSKQMSFQKVGSYVLVSIADSANTYFSKTNASFPVNEGDWIYISPNPVIANAPSISTANCGLFRVIKTDDMNACWIDNPGFVEESLVYGFVATITGDYILPNDTLSINTSILGNTNSGTRKILSVGKAFATAPIGGIVRTGALLVTVTTLTPHGVRSGDYIYISPGEANFSVGWELCNGSVDAFHFTYNQAGANGASTLAQSITGIDFQNSQIMILDNTLLPLSDYSGVTSLGTDAQYFSWTEGSPSKIYKFIENVIGTNTLRLSPASYGSTISEAAGSVISPMGKFNFNTNVSIGLDGYAHSTGLIAESSSVLYGDPSDPATYPGVAAAGNSIEISGPLIKRIIFGASIRVRTGVNTTSIINKCKSAVASVINASGVGEDISFSDIIDAINLVVGVVSVVVNYPTYNSTHDVIVVQNYEKALVLDAHSDVQITLIGT